ncbi:MAG TPA: ArdC-like ssDNA-binding domain-containing protein [Actinomycetota bacterium]|nr:ArdC-like ssDNA-binding domain-containing protein [Actinomycetota bacterium]
MSSSTQQMSATEALDFHHFSVQNAVQAQLACPSASCEAYRDILTRRRWKALGFAVRKGEPGTTITTWITTTSPEDDVDQPIRHPKRVFVFCRHQVERVH